MNRKIAITTGDVNGIGAEITIKALNRLELSKENVVLISNSDVLGDKCSFDYKFVEIPFDKKNILHGQITSESGEFSFQCLKKACEMAKVGEIDAIVTAPVSKEALHLAGHKFNGQTEVLQSFLAKEGQHAEMLFVAGDFRVLLLTRHVALKDISLNKEEVIKKITDLNEFFRAKFGVSTPNFALCALNPHAGENGILGREEIEILQPAVNELREKGINITNPLPADTLFVNAAKNYLQVNGKWKMENDTALVEERNLEMCHCEERGTSDAAIQKNTDEAIQKETSSSIHHLPFTIHPYDCYIACYHDQGLIPIKTVASEKTVNMTIGLDVIRTSPCHGTAFDIAGKNIASENSMIEAILQAIRI